MLNREELTNSYKTFDNEKIIKLAKYESKVLRSEAIPILENEIIIRNLDKNLIEWIQFERNFFVGAELQSLKNKIKNSKCVDCGKIGKIGGFQFSYITAFNINYSANLIVCERCSENLRKRAFQISITKGWISFYSIFSLPYYFLNKFFRSFKQEKLKTKIIENYIFENTGSIRKFGFENIDKIISKHNLFQKESNKDEPVLFI